MKTNFQFTRNQLQQFQLNNAQIPLHISSIRMRSFHIYFRKLPRICHFLIIDYSPTVNVPPSGRKNLIDCVSSHTYYRIRILHSHTFFRCGNILFFRQWPAIVKRKRWIIQIPICMVGGLNLSFASASLGKVLRPFLWLYCVTL